jgi:hypothetical protein
MDVQAHPKFAARAYDRVEQPKSRSLIDTTQETKKEQGWISALLSYIRLLFR